MKPSQGKKEKPREKQKVKEKYKILEQWFFLNLGEGHKHWESDKSQGNSLQ